MKRSLSEFTGLYPVSYTLKFELRPNGKTSEHLKKSGLLEQDGQRAEDYPKVKTFLDEQHKSFLEKVLSNITDIDWQELADQIADFQKDKEEKKNLEKKQTDYRSKIVKKFTADDFYAVLVKEATPSKLFKELVSSAEGSLDEVKTFARFACYFKGYQENRKNIYSAEPQQTAAAYRAVNENFTRFFSAVNIFSDFQTNYPDLLDDITARTETLCNGKNLAELFQINAYNNFLAQSGIDFINNIIGEVNYAVNQYRQQHKEIKPAQLPFMPVLYKQILSDRERAFAVTAFASDSEVYEALKNFIQNNRSALINGAQVDVFAAMQAELGNVQADSDLFIDAKSLANISVKTTGFWDTISESLNSYAEKVHKSKTARKKYCEQAVFNLKDDIACWGIIRKLEDGTAVNVDVTDFWHGEYAAQLFNREKNALPELERIIAQLPENLRNDKKAVQIIKDYLDAVQDIYHLIKPLAVSAEYGGDLNLQGIFSAYCEQLSAVIPLYNQVRNYATQKLTDVAKIKLMFNNPILASGWPDAQASSCVLFRENEIYYLGVLSDKWRSCLNEIPHSNDTETVLLEMMNLKQMADPAKDLPNLLLIDGKTVRKTGKHDEKTGENKILEDLKNRYLPAEINRIRKTGSYSKSKENFSRADLNAYIDYYKERIIEYKKDAVFNFRESSQYASWGDFTDDINAQAYQVRFSKVSKEFIYKLVNEGKLFLFTIWNKDFSDKSTGTPNKSTLYWKELFSPENLADVVFKLNGEAELFMRKGIDLDVTHRIGEKMVNRTVVVKIDDSDPQRDKAIRESMPENIHSEIYSYVNGKKEKFELSDITKKHLDANPILYWEKGMPIREALKRTVVKTAEIDMIKDKRFAEDKFAFHVPITVNFKAPKVVKLNERVLEYLRDNPDVKIIGIDRGEQNLIYLTLIDQQGRILHQQSLNIINGFNYQTKLDQRQSERDAARKSWQKIGQIKDLKAGYLSAAVYEITRMMVEHNAIVVMEDLNTGFKRGRMKIEKQIYQKFEKALIDKLNYLVFKNEKDHKAPGGVLAGYQLANKFDSFAKLGKQCGFIFYVPAGFTSKIDPETGFVDIFSTKDCTNAESMKAFLGKFDSIKYSEKQDAFVFKFDYRSFKTHQKDYQNCWSVYSTQEAYQHKKDKKSGRFVTEFINPTAEIKEAIAGVGLDLKDGFDLLDVIKTVKAENSTARFFSSIFYAFKLSTALRHRSGTVDKIISPVMNDQGKFFISGVPSDKVLPLNADANGAFHIALKGLYLLQHGIKENKLAISTEDWLKFAQTRNN